jgi:hypothetical protein
MLAGGLGFVLMFVAIPWILGWIAKTGWTHQRQMKALELRAETNAKLLDRLGSDPAFLDFLKSDAQRHLFDVALQDPNRSQPYMRMLTALQVSFLLLSAGIACLWVRASLLVSSDRAMASDREGFLFFGALGVALGIGSLCSAVAALVVGRLWHRLHDGDLAGSRSGPTIR